MRTELPSLNLGTVMSISIAVTTLIILVLTETLYKKALLDYSLSDAGIPHIQKITPEGWKQFWLFTTKLGGGKELIVLFVVSFMFCAR